jgi:hypothetical protein
MNSGLSIAIIILSTASKPFIALLEFVDPDVQWERQ